LSAKNLIFADNFCGQNFWDKQNRKKIRIPETTEFDERSIRYIAGIDLSASTNHPSFGVVGLTVMAYPSMKVFIFF